MSAWKAREIHKPRKGISVSQANRLEEDREKKQIRETHRRLKAEFLAREQRRAAA